MTLQATINRIFGEGGWLEACKGLRHEPAQHSYALDVCDWLTGDEAAPIGLIEGETGVGKTLGYLIPLMVHLAQTGHRGAVATHTIHLQSQIIEGDLLVAKECLSYLNLPHVSVQQVIGRHHFLDPERLERVIRYCLSEGDHLPHAEQLIRGAYRISRGSSLLADFLREYGPLPDHITGDDICVGPRSDAGGMEAFDAQLAAAKKAQLVITSHTMTLLNRRYRHGSAGIFESKDQPLAYLVVDEAEGDLGCGGAGDDGLGALAGVSAEDAVDLSGRAGPLALGHGEAGLAGAGLGREADALEGGGVVDVEVLPVAAFLGGEVADAVVEAWDGDVPLLVVELGDHASEDVDRVRDGAAIQP